MKSEVLVAFILGIRANSENFHDENFRSGYQFAVMQILEFVKDQESIDRNKV